MSSLVDELELCIRRRKLFRRGQPILIAVSGGLDSMVLLHLLHRLAPRQGWMLMVAHLNHCLRGKSSDADERLVRRAAQELGIPFITERAEVRATAREEKISIEMAARKLRHAFLARSAVRAGAPTIALAHHADDQLELFFLRLLRGSGGDGLSGMKWSNPSPANERIKLARPLLEQPKAQLRDFARQEKVRFREDASNAALDVQRNRIRNELLPLLTKKYQPALATIVSRIMDISSAEGELAGQMAARWLKGVGAPNIAGRARHSVRAAVEAASSQNLPRSQIGAEFREGMTLCFETLPIAVQRRCLLSQLVALGVKPVYELVEYLRLAPGKPICVSSDRTSSAVATTCQTALYRDEAGLLHPRCVESPPLNDNFLQVDLDGEAGKVMFDGVQINWHMDLGSLDQLRKRRPGVEVFDADRVGSPIMLRHWRFGDRFQPIGMTDSVKLQDFFTNLKIPRVRRRGLVLAANSQGEVFWVQDARISERFKLTPRTIRRLHWSWQKL